MGPVDIVIIAAIVALLFFSVRSLIRSNKNGCSECGGNCSAHGGTGECGAAKRMLADADRALARAKSCDCRR